MFCLASHNSASDQSLYCLLTRISVENKLKMKTKTATDTPLIKNGIVRLIRMDKSTKQIWVNSSN